MGIDYLLWLQGLRETLPSWVAAFFMLVSDLVIGPFIALIPCLVYWCLDRRRGLKVLLSMATGSLAMNVAKVVFCVPRPFMLDARVKPYPEALETATGYSFPSGHSQTAASVFGSLGWLYRKDHRWALPVAIFLALLVALSRNVLGVHSFYDVTAGLALGVASIAFASWLVDWGEDRPDRLLPLAVGCLALSIVACLFTDFKPYPAQETVTGTLIDSAKMALDCYESAGLFSGAFVCWYLSERYLALDEARDLKSGAVRAVVGFAVLLLFRYGLSEVVALLGLEHVTLYCKSFLTVVGAVVVAPWLFGRIERRSALKRDENASDGTL